IEKFKAIEGIASDVRHARTAIISHGGFGAAWGNSYECLFRLSGTPVELRLSGPIFIENGEAVRVVGRHNWNGCGSFRTTAKLRKIRLSCKFADLIQVNLLEIWLLKRHISLLLVVI